MTNIEEMTSAQLNELPELTPEQYQLWRDNQPDSPVQASLRLAVRGLYSLQELRIQLGNQCFAQFRTKLGVDPGEEADEAVAAKALKKLEEHYDLVTQGAVKELTAAKFKADGVFSDYAEFRMCATWMTTFRAERAGFDNLTSDLRKVPVYTEFLEGVHGCGNAMSGVLLTTLNPYRARYASSFWKYLGLDVARDGTGRSNKKSHNEPRWTRELTGSGEYRISKVSAKTHNPAAKSKVAGVLAKGMLMAGLRWAEVTEEEWHNTPEPFRRTKEAKDKDGPRKGEKRTAYQVASMKNTYVEAYLDYKHRKANSIAPAKVRRIPAGKKEAVITEIPWCETAPAHRERAALRYMVKLFLADFWKKWRELEGLPVGESYAEAYLGRKPHHDARRSA